MKKMKTIKPLNTESVHTLSNALHTQKIRGGVGVEEIIDLGQDESASSVVIEDVFGM